MVQEAPVSVAIDVRGVSKSFRRVPVLTGVSMRVNRGNVTVLQGANGAGKTTLLRILATVVLADEGTAEVAGHDVKRNPGSVRRRIGVAFVSERSLFWRLNALENLLLFAATRGVPLRDRQVRISLIAEELGMTHLLQKRVSDLSAGQRQRIILARAALGDPEVFILDEPFRGLDEEGVDTAIQFLSSRVGGGATVLVAAPTITEFRGRGFPLLRLLDGRVEVAQ